MRLALLLANLGIITMDVAMYVAWGYWFNLAVIPLNVLAVAILLVAP